MSDLNNLIERVFKLDKYALLVKNGQVFASYGIEKHETQSSIIWLINPNELKIDIKKLEEVDNINYHAFDILGMWACIIKDKLSSKIRAMSSVLNEYPWFYSTKNPIAISNNIFLVSACTDFKEIDLESVASFIPLECSEAGYTFIKSIRKNYGGDLIAIDNNSLKIEKLNLTKWLGFDKSINNEKIILDKYFQIVNESMDRDDVQIALTSGADSRAVLAGALKSGKTFKIMTGVMSTVDKRDVEIPSKISKILGVEHIRIDASKKISSHSVQEMLEEVALITSAEFMPTNWILYHKDYIQGAAEIKNITRLFGYEMLKPRKDFAIVSLKKLGILNLKYRDLVMDRILPKYNELKYLGGADAMSLYDLVEKYPNWASVNTRTFSRFCHVYNPLSDSELMKVIFRFARGIQGINFYKLVYSTFPKELQKVPINYPKIISLAYKFKRKYITTKVNYGYYLNPEFIKSELNFDLLEPVISKNKIVKMIEAYKLKGISGLHLHNMIAISKLYKIVNNSYK